MRCKGPEWNEHTFILCIHTTRNVLWLERGNPIRKSPTLFFILSPHRQVRKLPMAHLSTMLSVHGSGSRPETRRNCVRQREGGHGDVPNWRSLRRRCTTLRFVTYNFGGGKRIFFTEIAARNGTAATERECRREDSGERQAPQRHAEQNQAMNSGP